MIHQYRFVKSCNVIDGASHACMRVESIWELSEFSSQFSVELKLKSLKNKNSKKNGISNEFFKCETLLQSGHPFPYPNSRGTNTIQKHYEGSTRSHRPSTVSLGKVQESLLLNKT